MSQVLSAFTRVRSNRFRTWCARTQSRAANAWPRLRRSRVLTAGIWLLPEAVAIMCVLALLWAAIAVALNHEYYNAESAAKQATSNLARAFEESTRRTVSEIDQILLSGRAAYALEGQKFNFREWAKTQTLPDHTIAQIGMADKTGLVFADTLPIPPGVSIANRPHFQAQLHSTGDYLYISRPVLGRVSGKHSIQFVRKLLGPDGKFAGVIVFSLDCKALSRFYQTLNLGKNGFISLIRYDGTILARGPFFATAIGAHIQSGPVSHDVLSVPSGTVRFRTASTHANVIASFRHLKDYPLIVMVGFGKHAVFQAYRSLRDRVVATGIAITLTICVIGILWLRQKLRSIKSRHALKVTLRTINQGILMVDERDNVPVINASAQKLLGLCEADLEPNRRAAAARARALAAPNVEPAGRGAKRRSGENDRFDAPQEDGTIIEVRNHRLPGGGFVHTYTDVTEQRAAEARIHYLAHYDLLTGLANRIQLQEHGPELLAWDGAGSQCSALLMVDLDGFKGVNDTLGHSVGDELLIEVARRLQASTYEDAFVTRLGGDEFVIIQKKPLCHETALELAEHLLKRLAEPADVGGHQVRIGASIGIAFYPQDGRNLDTLLRHADIALYRAKSGGRGAYRCFDAAMVRGMNERLLLETELRQALERGELDVHFQPQFSSSHLDVVGFEALARWQHPTLGYVSPESFIPIAEGVGLIRQLGNFVLERACEVATTWHPACPVAVNVSTVQLQDRELVADIMSILDRTGLSPDLLELEVTESVMAEDNQPVLEALESLKRLGIHITLDDFGTGYSSLSYLRRFPFDKIKIDKSFIQGQAGDPGVRVILEAVLSMCQKLDLPVVGEGVETDQQLAMLRDRGCTEFQGYLLGRPMSVEVAEEFLLRKTENRRQAGSPSARSSGRFTVVA